jgi:hypothetical protein
MFNSTARPEMHDAWAAVTLADVCLAQGRYKEANNALRDAECHYGRAQSAMSVGHSDAILDELAEDVRVTLDSIRTALNAALMAVI